MESILLLSRLFLAAIFATAGITKLLDLKSSETAVRDFGVPESLVKPVSIVLPVSEVVIALMLFSLATAWIGAITSLIFLAWFTIGMGYQMAKGNAPDCHCFGQLHNEPVSIKSLVRNAIFSIPAVFLVAQGAKGQGPSLADSRIYTTEMVFGLALTFGVAGILLMLKGILDKQTQIMRRLEVLEVISAEGGSVERNEAGDPADGLPIGAFLPDFELPDLRGQMVNLEEIVGEGKPVLFLFVAPTCQPCGALLPEIDEWQTELADRVNFVFISTGAGEENVAKFGRTAQRLLVQKNREFQNEVYAKWTPSALLVNTDGRVASHIAAGDSAIRSLIEKVRSENVEDPFFYFAMERKDEHQPKIGESAPEFELKDLEGKTIDSRELRGKPTLVTFWSPTCPHCHAMIEQIKEWEKARGLDDPNLLVFSDGDPEAHREAGITSPILIDKAHGISSKFGMFGTPSAVLIDENGKIVSETAVGASNIWSLIGWRKDQ
jgi:thiol-disulfide isomerase/thioredoxin